MISTTSCRFRNFSSIAIIFRFPPILNGQPLVVYYRTLPTHLTLVEGLHLDGTFLMVDLHPQARVLLVLVLFFHMICSPFHLVALGRVGELRSPCFTGECDSHNPTLKHVQTPFAHLRPLSVTSGP